VAALGVEHDIPARELCTDNAAMIAAAAIHLPAQRFPDYLDLEVYAPGERPLAAPAPTRPRA
jgi:N6-L-threonylcarbamoyladenine synthase